MNRWFNTAGPSNGQDHYLLPVSRRLPILRALIDRHSYFVLHAPRQSGKTTLLYSLAGELNSEGRYCAAVLSMEVGAPFSDDPGAAELAVLDDWRRTIRHQLPAELQPPPWPNAHPGSRISLALEAWATSSARPLVLFLDEIDALRDAALISVLRQLRSGYPQRPKSFPSSVGLIGLRDVRDYVVASGGEGRMGSSSPFNIKVESLTLADFTADEVAELYAQHTHDTGQRFLPEAVARSYELTQGQPWLVNALARQLVDVLVTDSSKEITLADVDAAKEILIARQDTHLDSLAERLREDRVRRIVEPMLAGTLPGDLPADDVRFVCDLGLVRSTAQGGLDVANPIYREVIVRHLASSPRAAMPQVAATWLQVDGTIHKSKLLEAFLAFWRQHGEPLLASAPYHEVAPHLVLMAFLHRVVNGGGTITREYAIGRGRMDLLVEFKGDRWAIELKVWRDGKADPLTDGLAQLDQYMSGLGLDVGWLVIFDRRSNQLPIADRTSAALHQTPTHRNVTVIRA